MEKESEREREQETSTPSLRPQPSVPHWAHTAQLNLSITQPYARWALPSRHSAPCVYTPEAVQGFKGKAGNSASLTFLNLQRLCGLFIAAGLIRFRGLCGGVKTNPLLKGLTSELNNSTFLACVWCKRKNPLERFVRVRSFCFGLVCFHICQWYCCQVLQGPLMPDGNN